MEVGEEERYACAALFTLALHAVQVDHGAGSDNPEPTAWGARDEDEWETEASSAEEHEEPSEAVWASFWGWDCYGPGGILDRIFTALKIPDRSWSGLKRLPEVGGITYERRQHYLQLVSSFLQVLDSTLPAAHVTGRSYRALSDTSMQRLPASRAHVGYLPRVDDMLGLSESPQKASVNYHQQLQPLQPGDTALEDPFAASMAVIPDSIPKSIPGSTGETMSGHDMDGDGGQGAAGEGNEALGAIQERETEMLLDDSDSELEADLVFAHVMAGRPSGHAVEPFAEDTASSRPAAPLGPNRNFREADAAAMAADKAGMGREARSSAPAQGSLPHNAGPGLASQQTQAINSDLMSSMIHTPAVPPGAPPSTSHASLPPVPNEQTTSPSAQLQPDGPHVTGAPGKSAAEADTAAALAGAAAGEDGVQLAKPPANRKRAKPSHKAVAAMWELLESCIAQPHPQDPAQGGESEEQEGPLQRAARSHPPRVRWYDARSRMALRRVAAWLNVPWPTVANFEHLLAYQLLLPAQPDSPTRKTRAATAWENSIWAAKVGATTVGIGALFALTGGLAAPAIASGIGAAISMAGGGAAAAAGATGFLATTVGTAAVCSSMGVAGGSYAGTHMARRIGNVKEFGFWEVNESTLLNINEVPPAPETAESLAGSASLDIPEKQQPSGASPNKGAELPSGKAEAQPAGARSQDSEQSWASAWDEPGQKPQGLQQERPLEPLEPNPTFSPRREIDEFLHSHNPSDPTPQRNHSRSSSVVVELKELQPSAHGRCLMDKDTPGPPSEPDLDAGHISCAAIPRMGAPSVVVATSSTPSPRPLDEPAEGPQAEGTPQNGGRSESAQTGAEALTIAQSCGQASSQQEGQRSGEAGAGPSKEGSKKESPGMAMAHSSSASLESMAEPKKKRDKDGKRWLWKPKFREPQLLLAPISSHCRTDDMRMSLTIGVSGWIGDRKDYLKMWAGLAAPDSEVFTLVWESKALIALNNAIASFMAQQAYQEIAKWTLTHFFYTGLVAAFATPWLLVSFSQFIDHAWVVALDRAQKAGVLLAHTLMAGGHGDRPVTLIGYSMGARLIFHCLLELCRHNAKGVVEHVVLMGVPVSTRVERWAMARSAVAGRFVNAFSRRDWVLGLIYRGANGFVKGAGGLCPMNCPGIENINLTSIIAGHFDYISKMPDILDLVAIYG